MRGPLQPGGLPTVTTHRHPHSYPQDPEPLKGGELEPWGGRHAWTPPARPPSPRQASRALEEPRAGTGTQAFEGPPSLGDVCTCSGPWSLPRGSFRGQGPSWEGTAALLPKDRPARKQGPEGRLGASACWFPPGFWGERGGGLVGTGARLEPSVSQQSPPAPAPGKGPLASPPREGGKGPQREEAASGFQGRCSACGPLCIHSSRAALGSHGGALRERKRPQLSWPQVHMFLRNKAGLQSHFENNSIKISKEGTSPPPARNLPAHRLSCGTGSWCCGGSSWG